MFTINHNYMKLQSGYLFPEIERRVSEFLREDPEVESSLIRCGIGDVTEPLPDAARTAMKKAVDELGHTDTFRGYGPACGYEWLRQAIAEGDFRRLDVQVDPEEIFVSDGSKCDCGAILEILGQGNRIGITNPVYPVYVDTNVMSGNTGGPCGDGTYEGIHYLPCSPANDFLPEPPEFPLDIIYLCFPNNPTGAVIDMPRMTRWVEYALEHGSLILYDAAYVDFIQDESVPRSIYQVPGARRCAIEFHSFSKNGGFTGTRCGYTVCPRELVGKDPGGGTVSLHDLWSRRWSTRSNGVSYPIQRGAEALYSEQGRAESLELINHYMGNAGLLHAACTDRGWRVHGGTNAPYVWVECPEGMDSWQTFDLLLRQAHVMITPGVGFGSEGEGFFRISAFNSRNAVAQVCQRLESLEPCQLD
ncbi:MAG: LL-diaminopimelate aminotransferase [Phycisphaerae bacterium]|nr:LL-diaminopimelate aminotransferase [Phycisphaerae bacterium]